MILLVSTCMDRLSEAEFVEPIRRIVLDCAVKHYKKTTQKDIESAERIIICGTALKDNEYLENIRSFDWIKTLNRPILGICSGMQIIAIVHGGKIKAAKEIGMHLITCTKPNPLFSSSFDAYCLHGNGIIHLKEFDILARSSSSIQAFSHKGKKCFGIMFHPEVRNSQVITAFLKV